MGFIAEFELTSPFLRDATMAVPEMTLELEDLQAPEDSPAKYVFWARDGDFQRFEKEVTSDSSVLGFAFLINLKNRRLYRVTFTEEASKRLAYPTASEFDIVYIHLTQSQGTSYVRAQVPSRNALQRYREACLDRDIPFQLNRLYEEESGTDRNRYNLTSKQYEALELAYKLGYYGETRNTDLTEIAEQLDISRQALAGRLRRGQEQLIENTII